MGLAAVGFAGRYITRNMPAMSSKLNEAMKAIPNIDPKVSCCLFSVLLFIECNINEGFLNGSVKHLTFEFPKTSFFANLQRTHIPPAMKVSRGSYIPGADTGGMSMVTYSSNYECALWKYHVWTSFCN